MQVDPGESEGGRNKSSSRLAIGTERFAIENEFGVKLSRSPAVEHGAYRSVIDTKKATECTEVRSQSNNRTDVEVAIRPTIEPLADDARRKARSAKRLIDRRVTEGALNAE